jgi:large subunit ribosomal protein L13
MIQPIQREGGYILINAEGLSVGRLAAVIASRLMGKHRPEADYHRDHGDRIIVINAERVVFTGAKHSDKLYHRHTGFPGGIKTATARFMLEGAHPERVLYASVKGMLPKNTLGRYQLKNLRIYKGESHPHSAQKPVVLDVASLNSKNRVG